MKEIKIGPHDCLPIGQRVRVNNLIGFIKKCETVRASGNSGGFICLHTVKFDQRLHYKGNRNYTVETLNNPIVKAVNYSAIQIY